MSKLALGTVQFGMDYGISNQTGQVGHSEIERILDFCKNHGISIIDTAQGYGQSEKVLGSFNLSGFKVVTKVMGSGNLESSLSDLGLDSIYALMFHRENEVTDETWARFESWKSQKLVSKLGVSVYTPEILRDLIERYPIEIIQCPINLLDQRFVELLPLLKEKNIEVHTRSTFLQGLLLMNEHPSYFDPIKHVLNDLPENRLLHAIKFVSGQEDIDQVVVGVAGLHELTEIHQAFTAPCEKTDYSKFFVRDQRFTNPSLWKVNS